MFRNKLDRVLGCVKDRGERAGGMGWGGAKAGGVRGRSIAWDLRGAAAADNDQSVEAFWDAGGQWSGT